MISISEYSGIVVYDYQEEEYQVSKLQDQMFKYSEPFSNNYLYIVSVDNHNYMCHEEGKNSMLDWRVYGLPKGDKSESSHSLYHAQR